MALNLVIRKAIPSEVETLADIAFVAWERDLLPFLNGPAASRSAEQARLNAAVREGLDRIIVAEVNEVAVGWCQRIRGRAYIPFLFVTPLLQNQGIGSSIMAWFETAALRHGARNLWVCASSFNARARSLYERVGWVKVGELPTFVIPGATEILLHKRLD